MEHLTPESLARLVDEAPTSEERGHLNRCRRCRDELDALQAQTLGLSHLPDLRPPRGDWESLEVRLEGEGLVRSADPGREARGGGARPRAPWLQAAAGVFLLLLGAGAGAGTVALAGGGDRGGGGEARVTSAATVPGRLEGLDLAGLQAALGVAPSRDVLSLEEAEALVQATESWYLSALLRYRDQADRARGPGTPEAAPGGDPISRFAALEALMVAGQAAIREAPTDPFLNGLMMNVRAERDAVLRGIQAASTEEGTWY